MQDNNRKTKTEIKCVLGGCTKKATYSFSLSDELSISLCTDCWHKVLRQQTDKIKNQICEHEWHGDKDTMKNFCVYCEIEQPELENGENENAK